MQNAEHQIKAGRRSKKPGNHEEPGAGFIGPEPEPLFEIGVNGNELKAVIQRHEHIGDHGVANEVTKYDLKVMKFKICLSGCVYQMNG